MCSGDSDVRRGCHLCRILCPSGAMRRLRTEMLLLEICCQPVLILHGPAGSSGRVGTVVINLDFSGINSFLHSLWPRPPCLHATNLLNAYEPHEAVFNLSQKSSRWFFEYAVSIWQGYQVRATHLFFRIISMQPFCKELWELLWLFLHLCNSKPLTSSSMLVDATGTEPGVLPPSEARGFHWEAVEE